MSRSRGSRSPARVPRATRFRPVAAEIHRPPEGTSSAERRVSRRIGRRVPADGYRCGAAGLLADLETQFETLAAPFEDRRSFPQLDEARPLELRKRSDRKSTR